LQPFTENYVLSAYKSTKIGNPSQYIYNFPSCVCLISDQGTGDKGDLVTLALVL